MRACGLLVTREAVFIHRSSLKDALIAPTRFKASFIPCGTGAHRTIPPLGESVRAFVPHPLPPAGPPPLAPESFAAAKHAEMALARLAGVAGLVPSVVGCCTAPSAKRRCSRQQIEGAQATLVDPVRRGGRFHGQQHRRRGGGDQLLRAFRLVQGSLRDPAGLPISVRLLCDAHRLPL